MPFPTLSSIAPALAELGIQLAEPITLDDINYSSYPTTSYQSPEYDASRWNFGAELEATGGALRATQRVAEHLGGGVHNDGSVTSPSIEVLTSPAPFTQWKEQLKKLTRVMLLFRQSVDITCGTHIHISPPASKKLDLSDLANIYRVFANAEPLIYALVAPSRRTNRFCYPIITADVSDIATRRKAHDELATADVSDLLANFFALRDYTKELATTQKRKFSNSELKHAVANGNGQRYHGLNLYSYVKHKTIELRYHNGSLNADKIANFALLMQLLIAFATSATQAKRAALCHALAYAETLEQMTAALNDALTLPADILAWIPARIAEIQTRAGARDDFHESENIAHSSRDSEPARSEYQLHAIRQQRAIDTLQAYAMEEHQVLSDPATRATLVALADDQMPGNDVQEGMRLWWHPAHGYMRRYIPCPSDIPQYPDSDALADAVSSTQPRRVYRPMTAAVGILSA